MSLAPGTQLDGFQVLERLGAGGAGEVYRVQDALGRQLALKLLLGDLSERRLQRFAREGEIAATLRHPGIVRVHGRGRCAQGCYLVYELVQGEDLESAWRRLSRRQLLEVVLEIAHALGHAHAQGVVHRDLKPANVLLDAEGHARVTDFGLALGAGMDRLTRTGALVGTPHYMAPEQISGSRDRYGPPTDVWALGVLLYRALTDRLPFAGGSLLELMAQIADSDPDSPRALSPETTHALEAVCLRALQRAPDERYPDADAFAEDLARALEGAQVEGVAASRRLWPFVVAGGLGLAALASLAAWPRGSTDAAPTDAEVAGASAPAPREDLLGPALAQATKADPLRRACLAALAAGDDPTALRARLVGAGLEPARRGVVLDALGLLRRELPAAPATEPERALGRAAFEAAAATFTAAAEGPEATRAADLASATEVCLAELERILRAGLRVRSDRAAPFCETVFSLGRFHALDTSQYWRLLRVLFALDVPIDHDLLRQGGYDPDAERPWGPSPDELWAFCVEAGIGIATKDVSGAQRARLLRLVQGDPREPELGPVQRALLGFALARGFRVEDPELAEALWVQGLALAPHLPEAALFASRRAAAREDWEQALAQARGARERYLAQGRAGGSLSMALDNQIDEATIQALAELGRRDDARELFRVLAIKGTWEAGKLRERYPWLDR